MKDLKSEYKNMIEADVPDLWDRIESSLGEREPAISAKRSRRKIYYFSGIAAACVCAAIIIPLVAMSAGSARKGNSAAAVAEAPAAEEKAVAFAETYKASASADEGFYEGSAADGYFEESAAEEFFEESTAAGAADGYTEDAEPAAESFMEEAEPKEEEAFEEMAAPAAAGVDTDEFAQSAAPSLSKDVTETYAAVSEAAEELAEAKTVNQENKGRLSLRSADLNDTEKAALWVKTAASRLFGFPSDQK